MNAAQFPNMGQHSRGVALYMDQTLRRLGFHQVKIHDKIPGKLTLEYVRDNGNIEVNLNIMGDEPLEE